MKGQEKLGPSVKSGSRTWPQGEGKRQLMETLCLVIPQACPRGLYYLNVSKWLADILFNPKSPMRYLAHKTSCLCQKNLEASVQFSCSVVSDSLGPHGLQHTRRPCPSLTPRVYSNSSPLSQWCHSTISSSVFPFSSCLQSFPAIRVFSNESVFHIRWPKYWSFNFSISPSNQYSGLISFRMNWLDLLAV